MLSSLVSAHVGSPDVFYSGKVGNYDVVVVVQPPSVVPGVARVTVRTTNAVSAVTIRPVYWRAGTKGAPTGDAMRDVSAPVGAFSKVQPGMHAMTRTFEGSLWLMSRGAYSVEVSLHGGEGEPSVLVPVAALATGRLALNPALRSLLVVLGLFLLTGLVNIVRKGAGESLVDPGKAIPDASRRMARRAGSIAFVVMTVGIVGGGYWWQAVDNDYERTMYRPRPMAVSLRDGVLRLAASDTARFPGGRLSSYVPDHGKLMHLFVIKSDDASAFAHLHPRADGETVPAFEQALPQLPAGAYQLYGDVVLETGLERTLTGTVDIPAAKPSAAKMDPDDSWFVGAASTNGETRTADNSRMSLDSGRAPRVGDLVNLTVTMIDARGERATLEPYLGMPAHAVVYKLDGSVYTHLHPMGTFTMAAQDVFAIRERGDTTAAGALLTTHAMPMAGRPSEPVPATISFPYAFPRPGVYRLFVQVKHMGRVQTGAFDITVADSIPAPR